MTDLLHITERGQWEAAQKSGFYRGSTRGRTLADVGFIHCSQTHQIATVAAFVYGDYPRLEDLVLLVIDSDKIEAPIRYEAPEPGADLYPHIYGLVPVAAVTDVQLWTAVQQNY